MSTVKCFSPVPAFDIQPLPDFSRALVDQENGTLEVKVGLFDSDLPDPHFRAIPGRPDQIAGDEQRMQGKQAAERPGDLYPLAGQPAAKFVEEIQFRVRTVKIGHQPGRQRIAAPSNPTAASHEGRRLPLRIRPGVLHVAGL